MGIATAARLHLAAACANLSYAIDVTHWFHAEDVVIGGPLPIRSGRIAVPGGPGLGVELDADGLARAASRCERAGEYATTFTHPSRYRWWV